jgi:hypothetical protein
MRPRTYVAGFLFAAATLAWTPAGQTSDPVLAAAELPLEVWRDCSAVAGCLGGGIESRWVGRASAAGGSDLFLVRHTDCPPPAATDCRVYLIEKAPGGRTRLLLAFDGVFDLRHAAAGCYPTVEVRRALDRVRSRVERYEWRDGRYVRTAARLVFRIGGEDCGTLADCRAAAERALRAGEVSRALEIWRELDGLAWI